MYQTPSKGYNQRFAEAYKSAKDYNDKRMFPASSTSVYNDAMRTVRQGLASDTISQPSFGLAEQGNRAKFNYASTAKPTGAWMGSIASTPDSINKFKPKPKLTGVKSTTLAPSSPSSDYVNAMIARYTKGVGMGDGADLAKIEADANAKGYYDSLMGGVKSNTGVATIPIVNAQDDFSTPVTKAPQPSVPIKTSTKITMPDGSIADGYIQNGQTFLSNGNRIPFGAKVTLGNGKTYQMGPDGHGYEVIPYTSSVENKETSTGAGQGQGQPYTPPFSEEEPAWLKQYNASEAQRLAQLKQIQDNYNNQEQSLKDSFQNALGIDAIKNFQDTRNAYRKNALRGMDNSGVVGLMDTNLQNQYLENNQKAYDNYMTKLGALKQDSLNRQDTINSRYADKDMQSYQNKFIEAQQKSANDQFANNLKVLGAYSDLGYDTSQLLPYLYSPEGLQAMMANGFPLNYSLSGQETLSKIANKDANTIKTGADTDVSRMKLNVMQSQADMNSSNQTGTVWLNGKNTGLPTEKARQFDKTFNQKVKEFNNSQQLKREAQEWKKTIQSGNLAMAQAKLDQKDTQFTDKLNQDFKLAVIKLKTQKEKDDMASQLEYGKAMLNAANSKINGLLSSASQLSASEKRTIDFDTNIENAFKERVTAQDILNKIVNGNFK